MKPATDREAALLPKSLIVFIDNDKKSNMNYDYIAELLITCVCTKTIIIMKEYDIEARQTQRPP